MKLLEIEKIHTDGDTQARASLDEKTVAEYAEAIDHGAALPSAVVFFDGSSFWLADGFHRLEAARQCKQASEQKRDHAGQEGDFGGVLQVEVHQGDHRDARLHAAGANSAHGLRRTNADKRRAVQMILEDEEWSQWSDNRVAKHCGVSHTFVANVRRQLAIVASSGCSPGGTTRQSADGKTRNTANIGRKSAESPPRAQPDRLDMTGEDQSPAADQPLPQPVALQQDGADRPANEPPPQIARQQHIDRIPDAVHQLSLTLGKARGALGSEDPLIEELAPVVTRAKGLVQNYRQNQQQRQTGTSA